MTPAAPFRLSASQLMPLTARTDAAAGRRATGHLGAIVLCAAALWAVRGSLWAVPLTLLLGYMVVFLFNALHETAHQTAFRTRAWNYLLGHLAGFIILLPYEYYRAFHWDHHRYTQDPDKDPELAVPPPATTRALAWYVLGPPVWIGRIRMLLLHGLAGRVGEPWVPADKRRLIVVEARCYLLGYAAIGAPDFEPAIFPQKAQRQPTDWLTLAGQDEHDIKLAYSASRLADLQHDDAFALVAIEFLTRSPTTTV